MIEALDEEFRAAGLPSFGEMIRTLSRASGSAPLGRKKLELGIVMGMKTAIDQMPEPSAKQLEKYLQATRGKLRYQIRQEITKSFERIKKSLPRRPGTGRRKALDPQLENQACDQVAALIRQKVPYPIVLKRVGERFGVSGRTIQRAWQKRGQS
jgi:hypothetical protein